MNYVIGPISGETAKLEYNRVVGQGMVLLMVQFDEDPPFPVLILDGSTTVQFLVPAGAQTVVVQDVFGGAGTLFRFVDPQSAPADMALDADPRHRDFLALLPQS